MVMFWGQIIVVWQRLALHFTCVIASINNDMTSSAYISDQQIFFEMTIFADWQQAVRDNQSN